LERLLIGASAAGLCLLHGFQAATLFSIGSDDMAFVYLDGRLVCDDGGVHSSALVPLSGSKAHFPNPIFIEKRRTRKSRVRQSIQMIYQLLSVLIYPFGSALINFLEIFLSKPATFSI
jgi:hypothetical protein